MSSTPRRTAKRRATWPLYLIFILGLAILAYPVVTRVYYENEASQVTAGFDKERSTLTPEEIARRIGLAHAYNDALESGNLHDPYTDDQRAGVAEYARMLELNELMGHVSVPKLALDLPIYAGTQETVLQKGVGHLEGTSLPVGGNNTHTVLTAHRGLPTARLFSELDQLAVGDKFYITNVEGTIAYQVDQVKVVDPADFSELLVSPGHDYATLLTCTPYMVNSHRLLVRGHRIDYVAAIDEPQIAANEAAYIFRIAFFVAAGLLVITLLLLIRSWRRRRRLEAQLRELGEAHASPQEEEADASR
ncbi:MAG: class C sortase [Propionibacteriaceae bacterium]|nr:class C sortase [Propionibacteriaceae bacterium]